MRTCYLCHHIADIYTSVKLLGEKEEIEHDRRGSSPAYIEVRYHFDELAHRECLERAAGHLTQLSPIPVSTPTPKRRRKA